MSSSFDTRSMYNQINRSADYGIAGYHVEKVYVDPLEQIKQREYAKIKKGEKSMRYETKRGNYLDDYSGLHKYCPGPGTYKTEMDWPEKEKIKRNHSNKMTYIDEIIKQQKRNKIPAPGSYNVVKTLKQLQKEKKILAMKKPQPRDKINYLDEVQYESTLVPGLGNYNPRVRAKTQTSNSKMQRKPEEWRKVHAQLAKKKTEKVPDMTTYNPQASDYELFDSITKKKHNKNFLGQTDRFKSQTGIVLPPHKYSIIQKWRGKTANKEKIQRHGIESVSKGFSKSVYYH